MSRILVVEDDQALRQLIRSILTRDGHDVAEAADAAQCDAAIAAQLPDLVVMDMLMPGRPGVQSIEHLRGRHPALKILAVSGDNLAQSGSLLEMAMRAGASATLGKPFRSAELREAIGRLLNS